MIKYDFENKYPLWRTTSGIVLKTNQILVDGEVVQAYPDNDGNVWYYDRNRKKVVVE